MSRKLGSLMSLLGVHRTARLFISLWFDSRMPWWLKVCAMSGLIYIFSPLDVIPDISGIGLLDDLIVTLLIMQAFIEYAAPDVMREHCARLGIEPHQALLDVPRTVHDALTLYNWAVNRAGPPQPRPASSEPREPSEPEAPPPYTRYSAFQEEKEQA